MIVGYCSGLEMIQCDYRRLQKVTDDYRSVLDVITGNYRLQRMTLLKITEDSS